MNAREIAVAELEGKIGHAFKDRDRLERALTHASVGEGAKPKRGELGDNERLEFLGDRVLGLIVAERLIRLYSDADEGDLSKRLHVLVSRDVCARVAEGLGVGPALRMAAGESKAGGRTNKTILGDACEAIIAAVYLDGGLDAAKAVFGPLWEKEIEGLGSVETLNPKSHLQEWAAGGGREAPSYAVASREGPDHAPIFTVEVSIEGVEPARGQGRSRQDAEKAAAIVLLQREGLL
jgi:ribonuclease-3